MNAKVAVNESHDSQKDSFAELIEELIINLDKIKEGNNDSIKHFVYLVQNFKEKNAFSDKKEKINECCEIILSNVFIYLNNNDKSILKIIENYINALNNFVNGNGIYFYDSAIVYDEELENRAKELINNRLYDYDFSKIDNLYVQLYNALNKNDKKEIINIRGRIIRVLKKNEKHLDKAMEKMKFLLLIDDVLDSELTVEEKKIIIEKVLLEDENKDYAIYFGDSVNDLNDFVSKFEYICKRLNYGKIVHFYEDYKVELKSYGNDLEKAYEVEFLDKKLSIKSVGDAFVLSCSILANTIKEFSATDSKRKKLLKIKEAFKDIGRIVSVLPVVGGKVLKDNWYTLYLLGKGIIMKPAKVGDDKKTPGYVEKSSTDDSVSKKVIPGQDRVLDPSIRPVAFGDTEHSSQNDFTTSEDERAIDSAVNSNDTVQYGSSASFQTRDRVLDPSIRPIAYGDTEHSSQNDFTTSEEVMEDAVVSDNPKTALPEQNRVLDPSIRPVAYGDTELSNEIDISDDIDENLYEETDLGYGYSNDEVSENDYSGNDNQPINVVENNVPGVIIPPESSGGISPFSYLEADDIVFMVERGAETELNSYSDHILYQYFTCAFQMDNEYLGIYNPNYGDVSYFERFFNVLDEERLIGFINYCNDLSNGSIDYNGLPADALLYHRDICINLNNLLEARQEQSMTLK